MRTNFEINLFYCTTDKKQIKTSQESMDFRERDRAKKTQTH